MTRTAIPAAQVIHSHYIPGSIKSADTESANQAACIFCRLGGFCRKTAHFLCHNRKALSGNTRARRLRGAFSAKSFVWKAISSMDFVIVTICAEERSIFFVVAISCSILVSASAA